MTNAELAAATRKRMKQEDAARMMLAALKRSRGLVEMADVEQGSMASTDRANKHRAAIAAAEAAGIKVQS